MYRKGKVVLRNQDCIEGMGKLKAGSISCIATSPPYNIGTKYPSSNDSMPRSEYLAWLDEALRGMNRVMEDGASLFLNVGGKPSDPMIPLEVLKVATDTFYLQNTIHWVKSIAVPMIKSADSEEVTIGHYKPINSAKYLNDCHEYIFHFTKSRTVPLDRTAIGVPYADKSNVERWNKEDDKHCRGNVWFMPYKTIKSRDEQRPHPSTFPAEIPRRCFKLHGLDRIKRAMDPLMGIGTSAIVARELKLSFVGFEIEEEYYDRAKQNLSNQA